MLAARKVSNGSNFVQSAVSDTGIGMTAEHAKLLEEFSQLPRPLSASAALGSGSLSRASSRGKGAAT
jgi:signal transduction histidine kinase